jgi:hypothetical protein
MSNNFHSEEEEGGCKREIYLSIREDTEGDFSALFSLDDPKSRLHRAIQ